MTGYPMPQTLGPVTSRPFPTGVTLSQMQKPLSQLFNGQWQNGDLVADCREDWAAALVDAYNNSPTLVEFKKQARGLLISVASQLGDLAKTAQDSQLAQKLTDLSGELTEFLDQNN